MAYMAFACRDGLHLCIEMDFMKEGIYQDESVL